MTLDELFEKYHEAWSAVARQTDGDMQSAGRAGIRAIVRALRDETCGNIKSNQSAAEAWAIFEEILGDAGEKVAGGSTREDGQVAQPSSTTPATPKDEEYFGVTVGREFPTTDAAPAVCAWEYRLCPADITIGSAETECGRSMTGPMFRPKHNITTCACGKPIVFKAA